MPRRRVGGCFGDKAPMDVGSPALPTRHILCDKRAYCCVLALKKLSQRNCTFRISREVLYDGVSQGAEWSRHLLKCFWKVPKLKELNDMFFHQITPCFGRGF